MDQYVADIAKAREQRVQELLKDYSFLTLAGLYWLTEGKNCFGSDPANAIAVPPDSAPDFCGNFYLTGGKVAIEVAPGVEVTTSAGDRVTKMTLKGDHSGGAPDILYLGNLAMLVLERGDRYAIRLYDKENRARKEFDGLHWYPVDSALRIVADFVPYDLPQTLTIIEISGYVYEAPSPGYARFQWRGREYCLVAENRGNRLFYNFRDATNNVTTYGAGRFLYSEMPHEGKVVLDFNQATNPYCAYTEYAVCPLPPIQNRLDFPVEAGEKNYGSHPS